MTPKNNSQNIAVELKKISELGAGYFQSEWQLQIESVPCEPTLLGARLFLNQAPFVVVDRAENSLSLVSRHEPEATNMLNVDASELTIKPYQIYLLHDEAQFLSLALSRLIEQKGFQSQSLIFIQSHHPWPFQPQPSLIYLPDVPQHVIASMPLLDDKKIPSRLCHLSGSPGCFDDSAKSLAEIWLAQLPFEERDLWSVLSFGHKDEGI